jgi:hypothetical protein
MKKRSCKQPAALALALLALAGCAIAKTEQRGFSFIAAADMRQFGGGKYNSSEYFRGTCEGIAAAGKGAFMVSPGDIDPPERVLETIHRKLGKDYPWYPVVGNHEMETKADMAWFGKYVEKLPNLAGKGPENGENTTYSFDYKNAHFVVLNQYYDGQSETGADGDITAPLLAWLKKDLQKNTKPFIFVFGHEPILAVPDYDNGIHRHRGDSLDAHPKNSHRFQQLLRKHKATAYVCGHTHSCSFANINGLWQLDIGHCRGAGEKREPSSFLKILVGEESCKVEFYRDDANGGAYHLARTIELLDVME